MPKQEQTISDRLLKTLRECSPIEFDYLGELSNGKIEPLIEFILKEQSTLAKAFGNCFKCYGKGYATVKDYTTGADDFAHEGFTRENNPIRPCSCDRGKQILSLLKERNINID